MILIMCMVRFYLMCTNKCGLSLLKYFSDMDFVCVVFQNVCHNIMWREPYQINNSVYPL